MEGLKRFFYLFLGLLGIMMGGITILVVLIQYNMEMSPILTIFCAVSWILFIVAAFQTLIPEKYDYAISQKSFSGSKEAETEILNVIAKLKHQQS